MLPRCIGCRGKLSPISGNGPLPCRVMILGEGPARDEDRQGLPFVGRSGRELNDRYLRQCGLDRSEVYVTNISKCSMPGYRNPDLDDCRRCADRFLLWELERCRPDVVVTLGALAAKTLGIPFTRNHAMPTEFRYKDWSGIAFPITHPAAGLRSPDSMLKVQYGFERLNLYLTGQLSLPEDQYPSPVYRRVDSGADLSAYWRIGASTAIDTENRPDGSLFCASISQEPGTGLVLYPGTTAWETLSKFLYRTVNPIIMHASTHDVQKFVEAGISIPAARNVRIFHDTMVDASHRQVLPQGLKSLAWQLCGMDMNSFKDVVTPYSMERLLTWLSAAYERLNQELFSTVWKRRRDPQTRKLVPALVEVKTEGYPVEWSRLYTKLGRLILKIGELQPTDITLMSDDEEEPDDTTIVESTTDDDEATGGDFDPWRRVLNEWHDHDRDILNHVMGGEPMPLRDIADVPEPVCVRYSGRDADATLRVWQAIRAMPKFRVQG